MLGAIRKGNTRHESNANTTGQTPMFGTSVTTGGSAATKGTPVELIASTAFDAYLVKITAGGYGAAGVASQGALDILLGAATEHVLIANLLMGYCGGLDTSSADVGAKVWLFPLYIPAGSRIAAQAAGARTSAAVYVTVELYGGNGYPDYEPGTRLTTYGMGTVPAGTTITPGASTAAGAWTQITASTTEDHKYLVPSFQATGDLTTNRRHLTVEMGVGAATEELITPPFRFATGTNEFMSSVAEPPHRIDIPSGSRLTMRASNGGTNDAGYNGVIHAVS